MSDDKDDDTNERAIKKVVKKSVSDLFGEPEKPEPREDARMWRGDAPYGSGRQSSFLWEREGMWPSSSPMRQKATRWEPDEATVQAAWGRPEPSRKTLVRPEYNDKGDVTGVHFTDEAWQKLRRRIWKDLCESLDFERIVMTEEDNVRLEQLLDMVMRRAKFQVGEAGNYFRKGSLDQVPISIGDQPPAGPKPLAASVVEEDEGWDKDEKPYDGQVDTDEPEKKEDDNDPRN